MPRRFVVFLFVVVIGISAVLAEEVDVSRQWKEHASSAAAVSPSSTSTPSVLESTSTPIDCGCDTMTVPERLSQATYALTGVVDAVRAPKKGRQTVVVDVDEIFKGSPKLETEIITEIGGTACDLSFEEGKKYLIYARWEWGSYVTSRCMGTKRIDMARGDASALGPSEAMKEKLYIRLHNMCMGRRDTTCCLASLKAMRQNYYVPEQEGGCPSGTKPDRLLCSGSYTWCIPVTEKDHRQ